MNVLAAGPQMIAENDECYQHALLIVFDNFFLFSQCAVSPFITCERNAKSYSNSIKIVSFL
jgi:hypothetical protein